jgi:hypothetical protein
MLRITLAALVSLLVTTFSQAHEITPTIINAEITAENSLVLKLDTNLEALMLGVGSTHENTDDSPLAQQYNQLRATPAAELERQAQSFAADLPQELKFVDEQDSPLDFKFQLTNLSVAENSDPEIARESILVYAAPLSEPLTGLALSWPEPLGNFIFRVSQAGELKAGLYVMAGEQSDLIELTAEGTQSQGFLDYIIIGFEHIIPLGLDHILFVIGIYLLSQSWRALLWQVSAFTLAHTITLALATLGLIAISPSIVEPLIALSISYVAIENLFHNRLSRGRIALIFGFGLLHGLGFAGVLGEIGLNTEAFVSSLIAFNIGVELGQLAVIALMFALLGVWLGKTAYWDRWVRLPLSVLTALVGLYWFVERII